MRVCVCVFAGTVGWASRERSRPCGRRYGSSCREALTSGGDERWKKASQAAYLSSRKKTRLSSCRQALVDQRVGLRLALGGGQALARPTSRGTWRDGTDGARRRGAMVPTGHVDVARWYRRGTSTWRDGTVAAAPSCISSSAARGAPGRAWQTKPRDERVEVWVTRARGLSKLCVSRVRLRPTRMPEGRERGGLD